MKKSLLICASVCLALSLSSCFKVTVRPHDQLPKDYSDPDVRESKAYFLFGIIGDQKIDVAAACPHGATQFEARSSFLDQFLGFITIGIYTPRSYSVWCAKEA